MGGFVTKKRKDSVGSTLEWDFKVAVVHLCTMIFILDFGKMMEVQRVSYQNMAYGISLLELLFRYMVIVHQVLQYQV